MRVIAGSKRGTRLAAPKNQSIRPTSDRIKEDVFNLLMHQVKGCDFLDLFCGSGAIGIEAASRGAKGVDMVDISKESLLLSRENIKKCTFEKVCALHLKDALDFIMQSNKKYDIIYVDPPYGYAGAQACVDLLLEKKRLKKEGVIVLEQGAQSAWVNETYKNKIKRSKKYSQSILYFIEREE